MRYDLLDEETEKTWYIQCTLANRPTTLGELLTGIRTQTIDWQPDYEDRMEDLLVWYLDTGQADFTDRVLVADFRTQKPIRTNINWIPTDRL